jgi:hypothetical protein
MSTTRNRERSAISTDARRWNPNLWRDDHTLQKNKIHANYSSRWLRREA